MTDSNAYFDPYDVGINADPYPTYARLREEAPIYHNERYGFWALARHEDVQKALAELAGVFEHPQRHPRHHEGGHRAAQGRSHVRGPSCPHGASRAHVARLHTETHGTTRKRGSRFCVRCLDPLVGSRIRHHRGARVDAADAGDRHAPRHPRAGPGRGSQHDGHNLRTRPGEPMVIRQEEVANGEMFADYIEWRASIRRTTS